LQNRLSCLQKPMQVFRFDPLCIRCDMTFAKRMQETEDGRVGTDDNP